MASETWVNAEQRALEDELSDAVEAVSQLRLDLIAARARDQRTKDHWARLVKEGRVSANAFHAVYRGDE